MTAMHPAGDISFLPKAVPWFASRVCKRTMLRALPCPFAAGISAWRQAAAGYDVTGGYTDELLDDLVVWGTEEQVTAGLQRWIEAGMGKVIAQPLHGPDREASRAAAFAAVARAAG